MIEGSTQVVGSRSPLATARSSAVRCVQLKSPERSEADSSIVPPDKRIEAAFIGISCVQDQSIVSLQESTVPPPDREARNDTTDRQLMSAPEGGGGYCKPMWARHNEIPQMLEIVASALDVLTISRRLGHASPAVTLAIYGHLFGDTDREASSAIEAALRTPVER